jgi:hypothetical protein
MYAHRCALLGGAFLCANLLIADSAVAQTPGSPNTLDTPASRRDSPVNAAPTPNIDLGEADVVRRVLEDEARHRDRVARIGRLRDILSQRGDRVRLARLDDIERRELARHDVHQRRERNGLSDPTARGVDDIVRRGGTFRANARDLALARERQRRNGVDRDRADRDRADRDRASRDRASRDRTNRDRADRDSRRDGSRSPR